MYIFHSYVVLTQSDFRYIFRLGVKPDKVLGFLDAADIGPIVEQIFENRDVFLHKNMKIAGDFMSMNNFIEIFQK